MEFTPLERDILDWIADHSNDPAIISQLRSVMPIAREFTGVGSFTELQVIGKHPLVSFRVCPIDPVIESPDLEYGGGSVLFFKDGLASTLEMYSFVSSFPETLTSWKLLDIPKIPKSRPSP